MDNIIVTNKTLISVIDVTLDVARQISLDKPPKIDRFLNMWNISNVIGTGTIYAYSSETFVRCPIKISWNRNTDEISIGIYSADNKIITINRNDIHLDVNVLNRADFMVICAFQKLYNMLKFGVFANIYRKIYSKEEMKMNNNEEKKESNTMSQCELYDIMYEYMKPTIKKNVEEGGRWSAASYVGGFGWICNNTSSNALVSIGARFENGCWKIWTGLVNNVNITIDDNMICFNNKSEFKDFSEEFMRELYDKLKEHFSDSRYQAYCDTLTKEIEKAVSDPNGWESVKSVNLQTLYPTYRFNQYGKLEAIIDPFVCAKINNAIKDIKSETENEKETENDEKEIETINLLPIKKVFFNKTKKTTTVVFKDTNNNDKVVVSKTSPRDKYDPEMGLAMCITKEYFGNRNKLAKFVEEWLKENEPKNKQIARDERRKKLAKKKKEKEKEKVENAETNKTNESKDLKETKPASTNNKTKSKTKRFCDECICPPNNEEDK